MWMKSRFAQWEVEGQVRERVNQALRESEPARWRQTAGSARASCSLGSLLDVQSASVLLLILSVLFVAVWVQIRASDANERNAIQGSGPVIPVDRPVSGSGGPACTSFGLDHDGYSVHGANLEHHSVYKGLL